MSITEKLTIIAETMPKIYEKGKTDYGYKKSASGQYLHIDNINAKEKNLGIVLTSDSIIDFSNIKITVCGENILKMPNYSGVNVHAENNRTRINTVIDNGIITMRGYLGAVPAGNTVFNPYIPEHIGGNRSYCLKNTLDKSTAIKLPKGTYTFTENMGWGSRAGGSFLVYSNSTYAKAYSGGQSFTITEDNCYGAFVVSRAYNTDIPDFYYQGKPELVFGDVAPKVWEPYIGIDYLANGGGVINDIKPYHPVTNIFVKGDSDAVIHTEYYTDSEKVVQNLTNTIISLGGTI